MSIEITKNCKLMQIYVQHKFDEVSDKGGIIGVTFDRDKSIYTFYLNTNKVASYRSSTFSTEDAVLKEFLGGIAANIAKYQSEDNNI